MVKCPYFTTSYFPLAGEAEVLKDGSSFTVFICTEGDYVFKTRDKIQNFKKGDTILVPAALSDFTLKGNATLLEICIS